jgi:hypothetical protein
MRQRIVGLGPARLLAGLALLALLAGCATRHGPAVAHRAPPASGPDPWAPYIGEASARFGVPERWIRAVMQQESGGRQFIDGQQTTSSAGAMGLMQVVPGTYAGLRGRYGLGGDPYDPHDNIMAGAAYIREMYDRFGAPGFLAAYNAGPSRLDAYLNDGQPLPGETVAYLENVAPRLGDDPPMTGPLASFAGRPATRYAAAAALPPVEPAPAPPAPPPAAPLPIAPPAAEPPAYRPPASTYRPPVSALGLAAPAPAPAPAPVPAQPRVPAPLPTAASVAPSSPGPPAPRPGFVPAPWVRPMPPGVAAAAAPERPEGAWGIQVGAFATPGLARDAADAARQRLAGRGETVVGVAARPGGGVLFRARVTGLSAEAARAGCARVSSGGGPCIVVSPESS